jgi:hypothetical protein
MYTGIFVIFRSRDLNVCSAAELPENNLLELQLDQNSLASEMRTRGNERVSVRQGYGYGCRYGTLNEANLLKTARTCCSLEA